jgi:NAD(P)-dependent dehydrogenase (short-subunit alcohol dehydrogenase family)
MRLKYKVALITGAGSGIGRESAILFGLEGAKVVVADMNEVAGKQTVKEITSKNGDAIFIKVNVIDPQNVEDMVQEVITHYGRIDVLFNNAGISGVGLAHELDYEIWKKVMEVNVNGVFLVSKYVLPVMMEQKSGSIINMSSSIAEIGVANRSLYSASKGAVLSMTKAMQVDYAVYNIRINALLPGTIFTPFVEDYLAKDPNPQEGIKLLKKRQLSNELGKPIDVAYAALYLASSESKFIMGTPFVIDGGLIYGKKV